MNGSINYYPSADQHPEGSTSGARGETYGHLRLDGDDAYSPTLLVEAQDVDYLRRLASAAAALADQIDAAVNAEARR